MDGSGAVLVITPKEEAKIVARGTKQHVYDKRQ